MRFLEPGAPDAVYGLASGCGSAARCTAAGPGLSAASHALYDNVLRDPRFLLRDRQIRRPTSTPGWGPPLTPAADVATVVLNSSPFAELDPELLRLVEVLVVNEQELVGLVGADVVGPGGGAGVGTRRRGARSVRARASRVEEQ